MLHSRYLLFALLAALIAGTHAFAADVGTSTLSLPEEENAVDKNSDPLGVGVQVGTFSGLSFEYWYTSITTVNTTLTITRGNTAGGLTHQWMFRNAFRGDARAFVPFVGAGVLGVWANSSRDGNNFNYRDDRFALSLQVPVGIEFLPLNQRFGFFIEAVPCVEVVPTRVGFINGDIGARLFF